MCHVSLCLFLVPPPERRPGYLISAGSELLSPRPPATCAAGPRVFNTSRICLMSDGDVVSGGAWKGTCVESLAIPLSMVASSGFEKFDTSPDDFVTYVLGPDRKFFYCDDVVETVGQKL